MIRGLLDPKIDFIFKNIFGAEKNKRILISFLNSVLKNPHPITAVEIKNTDVEKAFIEDKFSRLDIKAETSNNEIINIEIQMKNELNDKCDEKDLLVAWTEFLKDPESERVRNSGSKNSFLADEAMTTEISIDSMILSHLLSELRDSDPESYQILMILADGLSERAGAEKLNMPRNTFVYKKNQLLKRIRKNF